MVETCPYCNLKVHFEQLNSFWFDTRRGYPDSLVAGCKCPNCGRPSVLKHAFDVPDDEPYGTDIFEEPELDVFESPQILFPLKSAVLDKSVPESIGKPLSEFKTCMRMDLRVAGAMISRKTLEQICIDQGATKFKLHDKIEELFGLKLITENQRTWAHEIKITGNEGAHEFEIDQITMDHLNEVDDFLEALIDHFYRLPAKQKAREAARNSRKKPLS